MSTEPRELLERDDVQYAVGFVQRRWVSIALLLVCLFALATRVQGWENYITQNSVNFGGNDGWYHYREIKYSVKNWPFTMPFDPWTGYPEGSYTGQFGTLFDQIIATVALIIGLGNPSDKLIRLTILFAPPVFGMLTVIPTYYVAKEFSGRKTTGLLAAIFLVFFPTTFYDRTLVGLPDHNSIEPLFLMLTVSATLWLVKVIQDEPLVLEMLNRNNVDALKQPVAATLTLALILFLYIMTWPPAIVFAGILFAGLVGYILLSYSSDQSAEPYQLSFGAAYGVTGLMLLPFANLSQTSPIEVSLIHITALFGVSLIMGVMVASERFVESNNYPRWTVPASALFVGILGIVSIYYLMPDLFANIRINLEKVFGLGTTGRTATIGEAQSINPFSSSGISYLIISYGMLFTVSQFGILSGLYNGIRSKSPQYLLLGVFGLLVQMMALTQIRFNYYFAPMVAVFGAYVIGYVLMLLKIPEDMPRLGGYQIAILIVVGMVIVPFLAAPVGGSPHVMDQSSQRNVEYNSWEPTLEWMNGNTPEEGQLGSPSSEPMEYYGSYERTSNYEYPDGAYGVMSWWDYGHWITVTGERIPVANPFQQNADVASDYLLAQSEEGSSEVLDRAGSEGQARYTVINWEMASEQGEFRAITVFNDNNSTNFSKPLFATRQSGRAIQIGNYRKQAFYNATQTRMYYYHGSRIPESSFTFRIDERDRVAVAQSGEQLVTQHRSPEGAEIVSNADSSQVQGGVGLLAPEPVPAMEHHRLVRASEKQATDEPGYNRIMQSQTRNTGVTQQGFNPNPAYVKVFERVPGATIRGQAQPNATVVARVNMSTHYGDDFVYLQETTASENGTFSMTVPYSTTGYDNWSPEDGYTNVSTRAESPYQVTTISQTQNGTSTQTGTVQVSEAKVIGEDTSAAVVQLNQSQNGPQTVQVR